MDARGGGDLRITADWKRFLRGLRSRNNGPIAREQAEIETPPGALPGAPSRPGAWLARWRQPSRRARQLAALEGGYNELLGLIRTIREHLDRQDAVQREIVESLQRLPESLQHLRAVARAAEQQSQVLDLLSSHVQAWAAHDQKLIESLQRFNATLATMDETHRSSAQAIRDFAGGARDSAQAVRSLAERSERRMMWVLALLTLLTASLGAAALFAARNLQNYQFPAVQGPAFDRWSQALREIEPMLDPPEGGADAAPDQAAVRPEPERNPEKPAARKKTRRPHAAESAAEPGL